MPKDLEGKTEERRVKKIRRIVKKNSGNPVRIRSIKTGRYYRGVLYFNDPGDRRGFFNMFVGPERYIERFDYEEIAEIHPVPKPS